MYSFSRRPPTRIVARFVDENQATAAKDAVSKTLDHAEKEVQVLLERQNGIADSLDVSRIYARHGFANDSGWCQERPLSTAADELVWEIPEGMDVQEAKNLLVSFGALSVSVGVGRHGDDLLGAIPHPASLVLSDLDNDFDEIEEDDIFFSYAQSEKKILH